MRTAIVGCGAIAKIHLEALAVTPRAEIVAVVDARSTAAEAMAKQCGARPYRDVNEMLEQERPQIVHVLTPPHTHAELGMAAVRAGAHVLIEKPMTTSADEARELLAVAKEHGVVVTTSHNYLYKPSVLRAKELIATGAVGDVIDVESYYGVSPDESTLATSAGAHWSWRLRGGVFTNFLPHAIYLASEFIGKVTDVDAVQVMAPAEDPERTTELVVAMRSERATGRLILTGRVSPYMKYVEIRGTRGTVRADLVRETCTIHRDNEGPGAVTKVAYNAEAIGQLATGTIRSTVGVLRGKLKSYPGLRTLILDTHAALEEGRPVPISPEAGMAVVETMERIWAQAPQLVHPPSTEAVASAGPRTAAEEQVAKRLPVHVLVTGAAGYLGSRVVAALHRAGADVRALVRDPRSVPFDVARRAELVAGDITDPASLDAVVKDVDVVIHCAAITTNQAPWSAHESVNIAGTRNLTTAAAAAGVERFVHVSSVLVYGLTPNVDGRVPEDTPLSQTEDKWAFYERSKVGAEEAVQRAAAGTNMRVVVCRPGILYGDERPARRGFMRIGGTSVTIGRGDNHLPLTHVDGAVDALLLMTAEPEAQGAYNVVDEPQPVLRDLIKQEGRSVPLPSGLLRGAARLSERKAERSGGTVPPRLSQFVIGTATRDVVYSTDRVRNDLNYSPSKGSG